MGYRSNVAIKVRKVDYDNAPNNVKDIITEVFTQNNVDEDTTEKDDMVVFYAESVKWYRDYEDVSTIMDWIESLNEDDYGMIIVGEDYSDVEFIGNPFDNGMSVSRIILW